jgi:hypothetical protein
MILVLMSQKFMTIDFKSQFLTPYHISRLIMGQADSYGSFFAWPISCFHAFSAHLGSCTKQVSNGSSGLLQLIVDLYLFWSNPSILVLGWSDGCFQTSPRECFWARPYFHGLIILSLRKNAFYYATHTTFFLGPIFLNYKISHDFIFRSTIKAYYLKTNSYSDLHFDI